MIRRALGWLRAAMLTVAAVVGAVCLLVLAAGLLFGVRPLVVQSGSMSPTIGTGALAWARQAPADHLEVGDIVMVPRADGGDEVMHRIVSIAPDGDGRALRLKGDANDTEDSETYYVTKAYRVFGHVPFAGRVVAWFTHPVGVFLLGMYAAGLLLIVFRRSGSSAPGGGRRRGEPRARSGRGRTGSGESDRVLLPRVNAVGAIAACATLALVGVSQTGATFTDTGSVAAGTTSATGAIVTGATTMPTLTCTNTSTTSVTVSWPIATSPATNTYTATIAENGQSLTVNTSGGTASVVVSTSLLSTLFGSTVNVRVVAHLGTNWISTAATAPVTTTLLGLSISCGKTAAASCSVINTVTGLADPGSSCALTAATCTPNGNGLQTHVYLTFTGTFNDNATNGYGNNLKLNFSGNLQTLGCSDPSMTWTTAGTTSSMGNVTWTPTGFPCSNLPTISGSVARFQAQNSTYAGEIYYNRTPVAQSSLSCTK